MKSLPKSRPYDSPTRKAQAETTRAAIVRALVDLIVDEGPATISIPQVARRAGVSVRSVYHYFPNKESLFDGVTVAMPSLVTLPDGVPLPTPTTPAELVEAVPRVIGYFRANTRLFRALSVSEVGDRLDRARWPERMAWIDRALAPLRTRLEADEFRVLRAAVGVALSFDTIDALIEVWGLSVGEATDASAWTVRALCDKARRRGVMV